MTGPPEPQKRSNPPTWILQSTPRWTVLAGVLVGSILGGASGGFAAAGFDVDWVNAIGTWVAALATTAAVLVAYVVFRAERSDKALEREAASLREVSPNQIHAREVRLASMVKLNTQWGSGTRVGGDAIRGWQMRVSEFRCGVHNESTEMALDVEIECSMPGAEAATRYGQLAPNERQVYSWRPNGNIVVPENQAQTIVQMEPFISMTFWMFDRHWRWNPSGAAEEVPADE